MGRKEIDLTGKRFGKLTAKRKITNSKDKNHPYWECECDCGNIAIIRKDCLQRGISRSCGCWHEKHGLSYSKLYSIWASMKDRCDNPNNHAYNDYGGRGITYCSEWSSFISFSKWSYKEGYDEKLSRKEQSLDRIDVNGNYEPSNCRWVSCDIQNYNKRDTQRIFINDKQMTLKEISEKYGISITTIRSRYKRYKRGLITEDEMICTEKLVNKPQQILITINGITKNLTEWEKSTGVSRKTIIHRYRKGIRKYEELFKKSR